MTQTRVRTIDDYIEKIEKHLLKKYPNLEFKVWKRDENEARIYYSPYHEEELFDIIHRMSGMAIDALADHGYVINLMPASE